MTNLRKLDDAISDIERQAELLKSNNTVLTKVSDLSQQFEKAISELSKGNQNFDLIKKDLQISLKGISTEVTQIKSDNEKHIDKLIDTNKKLLREFEDTLNSKIERFSSDIQVTIRQERSSLQESLQNNITTQFNAMEAKQKDLFLEQSKKIKLLQILLIVSGIVSLGISIAILVK